VASAVIAVRFVMVVSPQVHDRSMDVGTHAKSA
jgi:hypothetical protein